MAAKEEREDEEEERKERKYKQQCMEVKIKEEGKMMEGDREKEREREREGGREGVVGMDGDNVGRNTTRDKQTRS